MFKILNCRAMPPTPQSFTNLYQAPTGPSPRRSWLNISYSIVKLKWVEQAYLYTLILWKVVLNKTIVVKYVFYVFYYFYKIRVFLRILSVLTYFKEFHCIVFYNFYKIPFFIVFYSCLDRISQLWIKIIKLENW